MTVHIKSLTLDELTALMSELGQPKFRAKQLYEWLHKHNATSYDQLTNIPKELRAQLSERYPLFDPVIIINTGYELVKKNFCHLPFL